MEDKQRRYDLAYLKMALDWGKLSHAKRKKVGAIIVKDGMIISDWFNGTPSWFDNSCEDPITWETLWYVLHAEANAILKLAKSTQSWKWATLYLAFSPCRDCSKLIHQAWIKRLVYNKPYKDAAGLEFLQKAWIEIEQIELD